MQETAVAGTLSAEMGHKMQLSVFMCSKQEKEKYLKMEAEQAAAQ